MQVFISYAREDTSLAHILAYFLEKDGKFTCHFDRDLRAGHYFDQSLREMISDSDLVLVLLTKSSLQSAWVNQEIGFATALRKFVYPLAIQADVDPKGMIEMCHKCSMFDWSDSKKTIKKLIEDLRSGGPGRATQDGHVPLDKNLESTYARSHFLNDRLDKLLADRDRKRVIRQQAAFSIFGVSADKAFQRAGEHSDEYMKLLLKERRLTDRLVCSPQNEYRLILWPVRHSSSEYQALRFRNLLTWLKKVASARNIDIRCGSFPEPNNRLIVSDGFVLDGSQAHQSAGFGYSVARFQPKSIDQATHDFEDTWKSLKHDKKQAINLLTEMAKEFEQRYPTTSRRRRAKQRKLSVTGKR